MYVCLALATSEEAFVLPQHLKVQRWSIHYFRRGSTQLARMLHEYGQAGVFLYF